MVSYRLRVCTTLLCLSLSAHVIANLRSSHAETALPLAQVIVEVSAIVETEPVPHAGDAADDPAIWIHPAQPSLSTIIGTDKLGGLAVYALDGHQLHFLPDGNMNNVDLRYNFPLGGQSVALVTAGNRTNNSIAIYRVNPVTRGLENIAARTIVPGLTIYGSCMYHSHATGKYYLFLNSKSGAVEQWQLIANATGLVDATLVRTFDVGSDVEGCVADDEWGFFYISEEAVGIWKYGAEPGAGSARTQVDTTAVGGHLTSNVEGLTIYYASSGAGYLIASSQGSNDFAVYERGDNNAYRMTFAVAAGNGVDAVTSTDGIDVTNFGLGSAFPAGVFVAQDDNNDIDNQNFKLIPWPLIASAAAPALIVDSVWDPRNIGRPNTTPSYYKVWLPAIMTSVRDQIAHPQATFRIQ